LQVLITVTVVFLITTVFTFTSTAIVAVLHNMARLRVGLLPNSPTNSSSILNSSESPVGSLETALDDAVWLLVGFLFVEQVAFLLDEMSTTTSVA
jgi:hypothetical protein